MGLEMDVQGVVAHYTRMGKPVPPDTAKQLGIDAQKKTAKPSKYKNRRTMVNGTTYDSEKEANRAAELALLCTAGEVIKVFEQVPFPISDKRKYVADFVVLYPDGHWEVEDAKGMLTDVYKIKRDLIFEKYGIKIKEV